MIRRRLAAALLLGVLVLAGCATAPPTLPSAGPWAERLAALSGLDHWTVEGRIAVNKAAEGWTASLLWTQRGTDYTIDLIGPLGQGRLRIQGDATGVQARTADGQLYRDDDPARLLERATGVQVPVADLAWWVRGMPNPKAASQVQGDDEGRLTRLEQGGWVVEYSRYQTVDAVELPARLRAQRDDVQVRLAIGQWNLQPAAPPVAARQGG